MILDFEEALAVVMREAYALRANCRASESERVATLTAAGRVLARPVLADRDQPPFDRATRDGFALRADDLSAGKALKILGQVRAGDAWTGGPLAACEAIEIMTGAPLPAGADAVVMVEHVTVTDFPGQISTQAGDAPVEGTNAAAQAANGWVHVAGGRTLRPGENVVSRGSEARAGETVVAAGTQIGAAEIALAATCGMIEMPVCRRSIAAIVATGDELVELDEIPGPRQIRNSNSYAIAAMVTAAGGQAKQLKIARDTREDVRERVAQGRLYDLLLLSGGVSMGKFDLVEEVLAEFGAEFFFTGVKMQPGKPLVFGRLPERDGAAACFFFGLPGNPISTQVTFHCFVEPFLRVLCGEDATGPRFVQATLAEDVPGRLGLMRVLPARLTSDLKSPTVRLIGWQGSGDLAANARANCYAALPPDRAEFHAGDVISVLLR